MFWGGVPRYEEVALVNVTGIVEKIEHWGPIKTMDQHKCKDLLSAYLFPFLKKNCDQVWVFQQDSVLMRNFKIMKEWFWSRRAVVGCEIARFEHY
ncbi:hypothetical protein BV898_03019 [Hypsibius exemplaris]|uniref:Uncharacterized protein n=1 Tax=Hypsibius exemplaris TaxID=2072580 RepID=A0A1W0X6G2_HYPEX|nr:hypothetical protein BV898_03019 [Hypsibius exemplaris]